MPQSHRDKMIECEKTGNLIYVNTKPYQVIEKCPDMMMICIKYKTVCRSKACAEERGVEIK